MKSNRITLSLKDNQWYATWYGPEADKLVELFGTSTIPTPFTAATPAADVQFEIASHNRDYLVMLADDVQAEIQSRIFRGELEATDADGVTTMRDLQ